MRKSISMLLSCLFGAAAVLVATTSFAAEGNAANGKKIFTQGKGAAAPCMSCHGDNGQGNDMMGTPRLANQGQAYIIKQLADFAADKRVPTGLGAAMNGFAKALSEEDRRDVAAYMSSIAAKPELSDLKALQDSGTKVGKAYEGKVLVTYGVMAKDHPAGAVPACKSCHQWNGRGAFPMFPMIGQQKFVYLTNQLKHWRDGSRHNDVKQAMQKVAQHLSDQDIQDLAAFLAGPEGVKYAAGEYGNPKRHVPFEH